MGTAQKAFSTYCKCGGGREGNFIAPEKTGQQSIFNALDSTAGKQPLPVFIILSRTLSPQQWVKTILGPPSSVSCEKGTCAVYGAGEDS